MWSADATALVAQWAVVEPRVALFDFNGTLSEDEQLLREVFAEVFAERYDWEMTPAYYQQHLLGLSDREILERVAREHSDEAADVEAMLTERRDRYLRRATAQHPVTSPDPRRRCPD